MSKIDETLERIRDAFKGVDWGPEGVRSINGMTLIRTCTAFPEQYDVLDAGGDKVGYLRLRHGEFRAECRDRIVYEAEPVGDGLFEPDERDAFLTAAVEAIKAALEEPPSRGGT